MSDIVSPLLQWLNTNPQWAGVVIFAISAGESAPIFGTLVPGSITMTAFGALAGAGVIPLWSTLLWAILGAIVGDGIGYWIGHYFKDSLHYVWPFKQNPQILGKGEIFFKRYGGMSVFVGRFVGPVRALVPIVAGMLGMKPLNFIVANVTSAIGWAPAYMLPGILLGAVSLELPPEIAMHVILVLLFIFLFILLCLWFTYKLFQLIQNQITQLENWLWQSLRKKNYFAPITFLLRHDDPAKTHGQLNLALFFIITTSLLIFLLLYVHFIGSSDILINQTMFHFFRGIRTKDFVDNLMLTLTLLGQKQIILTAFIVMFGWLLYCKHWRTAFHTLALGILAAGSIYIIKHVVQSPRPWGIFNNPDSFSMPSGHTTLATVFFVGLAFLISKSMGVTFRRFIYTLAILIAFIVGISRLYLGAHWFTDVVAAWLLSIALISVVIISYQRGKEETINALGIFAVSITTLLLTFGFFYQRNFPQLQTTYAQISLPINNASMNDWWLQKRMLLPDTTNIFGFRSQRINLEWLGALNQIEKTLRDEKWTKPPARDLISTIHRIADISSSQYLPLVSPLYLDKKPAIILTRQVSEKIMLVVRLWDSNLQINTDQRLWVGFVDVVPRSYSWLFKKRSVQFEISPDVIFLQNKKINNWEWKMITNDNHQRKILLIRKQRT